MSQRSPSLLALSILWLSLAPVPGNAAQSGDFLYTTNNGTVTITNYTGGGGNMTIPDTIAGMAVTGIGAYAFQNNGLTRVTIGASVTNVGDGAFTFCNSLTALTVAALNSDYGDVAGVLFNKSQTTLIQYPGGKTGTYTIPNGVARIGNHAFAYGQLTGVTIPTSVTEIGDQAFAGTWLGSIIIPNSVMTIGDAAFTSASLTNILIPDSVTHIGDRAFSYCERLSAITVDGRNSVYGSWDGALFDKNQTELIQCPEGKAGGYAIPGSVIRIGDSAFWGCASLTRVAIPGGVTSIGEVAFTRCGLTSATIPESVTNIGEFTFKGCGSLTNVTLPNSVMGIGQEMFAGCTSLTRIVIPNSVTRIGPNAFAGSGLTHVTIPNSVTNLGEWAFANCSGLTGITLPNGLPSIERATFWGCTGLASVTIPDTVTNIGNYAFNACMSLTSITVGNHVASIVDQAFDSCTRLAGVYFMGNAPTLLGPSVFHNANKATVYYLAGTTGWGSNYGDRPTRLWTPPFLRIRDTNIGARTNRFGFTLSATNDWVVVVEACTDLANPIWSEMGSNTLTDSSSYFSDPDWTNYPARFYRLRQP